MNRRSIPEEGASLECVVALAQLLRARSRANPFEMPPILTPAFEARAKLRGGSIAVTIGAGDEGLPVNFLPGRVRNVVRLRGTPSGKLLAFALEDRWWRVDACAKCTDGFRAGTEGLDAIDDLAASVQGGQVVSDPDANVRKPSCGNLGPLRSESLFYCSSFNGNRRFGQRLPRG